MRIPKLSWDRKRFEFLREDLVHALEGEKPVKVYVYPGAGLIYAECPDCGALVLLSGKEH